VKSLRKSKKMGRKKKNNGGVTCPDCIAGTCKIHSEPPKDTVRPSWDEYFMNLAEMVGTRATCTRHKLGAVLVRDRRILATGYNGAPKGLRHCLDIGCLRDKLKIPSGTRQEICRAVHAEQNAVIQAAVHGVSTAGSDIYITHSPCSVCAKILINAGIKRIFYKTGYPDEFSKELLAEAGIELVSGEVLWRPKMIIGLVGQLCSGKGTVGEILEGKGFARFTFSDRIREECRERGILEPTRTDLQNVGDELRLKFGGGVLAERLMKVAEKGKCELVVVDGIRNPGEVAFLRKYNYFYLWGVKARRKLRYERMRARLERQGEDVKTWEEFKKIDTRDEGRYEAANGQKVGASLRAADRVIVNNGTLKELVKLVERELKKITK
jgi:dCMP deaminase